MTLKDVLNTAADPRTPIGLSIITGNLGFCTTHTVDYLLENSNDELLEREILALDIEGFKLILVLK